MSGKRGVERNGAAARKLRAFRLSVMPGAKDDYGVTLAEGSPNSGEERVPVVVATPAQTSRVVDAVLAAVRASGRAPSTLSSRPTKPIEIQDEAGVRLAVILLATQPLTASDRIRRIVAGVNIMSVEETYYWYAKCVGENHSQARKALRILLADPKASR